jgi:hypothetical protein
MSLDETTNLAMSALEHEPCSVLSANKRRSESSQFPPVNDDYFMPKRTFSNGKLPLPEWFLVAACQLPIAASAAFSVSSSKGPTG